jgi:hypothetical protein
MERATLSAVSVNLPESVTNGVLVERRGLRCIGDTALCAPSRRRASAIENEFAPFDFAPKGPERSRGAQGILFAVGMVHLRPTGLRWTTFV